MGHARGPAAAHALGRLCRAEAGKDFDRLRQSRGWLTEPQLRAALTYYELYPHEIDARLEREAQWTPERVARDLPFARPRNG
jgi:hypothetical protein